MSGPALVYLYIIINTEWVKRKRDNSFYTGREILRERARYVCFFVISCTYYH